MCVDSAQTGDIGDRFYIEYENGRHEYQDLSQCRIRLRAGKPSAVWWQVVRIPEMMLAPPNFSLSRQDWRRDADSAMVRPFRRPMVNFVQLQALLLGGNCL